MIMLIIIGVLTFLFVLMLIFSATSYNRMIKTYTKYDDEFVYCNLTGFEFAVYAIKKLNLKTRVALIEKELDECYIPSKDVVCISQHTANIKSVSSICITAHELGHAVQNKKQSGLFVLQACLTWLGKISMFLFPFMIISGIVLLFVPNRFDLGIVLLLVAIGMLMVIFLLKIFTIPMEMEASKIAYNFLKENNILIGEELKHGKKVLDAAIGTYIASLFMPILKFFRGFGRLFRR